MNPDHTHKFSLHDLPPDGAQTEESWASDEHDLSAALESASPQEQELARLVTSREPRIEQLTELYGATRGGGLKRLLQYQRRLPDKPAWMLVAMTRRLMRATEVEQGLLLHAMSHIESPVEVCSIARTVYNLASTRTRLACCALLEQMGDRQDLVFLQSRHDEPDLRVAIKRALAAIEQRHPAHAVSATSGALSMSNLAGQGALSSHDAQDMPRTEDILTQLEDVLEDGYIYTLAPQKYVPEAASYDPVIAASQERLAREQGSLQPENTRTKAPFYHLRIGSYPIPAEYQPIAWVFVFVWVLLALGHFLFFW